MKKTVSGFTLTELPAVPAVAPTTPPTGGVGTKTRSRGFTLIELLVVIAIIAVLAGLLIPTVTKARAKADQVDCLSNLKQVGIGISLYSNKNRGKVPYVISTNLNLSWAYDISDRYLEMDRETGEASLVFLCKAQKKHGSISDYALNTSISPQNDGDGKAPRMENIPSPSTSALVIDGVTAGGEGVEVFSGTAAAGSISARPGPSFRHLDSMNVLYCDLHAGTVSEKTVKDNNDARDKLFVKQPIY